MVALVRVWVQWFCIKILRPPRKSILGRAFRKQTARAYRRAIFVTFRVLQINFCVSRASCRHVNSLLHVRQSRLIRYQLIELEQDSGQHFHGFSYEDGMRWITHAMANGYACQFNLTMAELDESSSWPQCILFSVYSPCLGFPGEGPPLKVSTLNVTALGKRLDTVLAFLQAECTQTMLLQETRISPKCIESIRNRASKAGWVLHIGFQPPLSKVMGPKGFFRQPTGGLATLVHKQIPSAAIQFPQNLQHLHQYCLPIWLSVSNGRTGLVLVNCYLPTGSAARATREEILRDIFQFASLYDHCPVIIGGDLQMDTSESSAIAEALCSGLWYDFDADLRASKKIPLEATFSACGWSSGLVGPHRTRIDHFLLNHFSIAAAKDVQIFRGPLAPGHCPINLELDVEVFCTECMMLKPVESWNLPPRPRNQQAWQKRNEKCLPIFQAFLPSLLEHAEHLDVCNFWDTLCDMVHDMLDEISQQKIRKERGKVPSFQKAKLLPPSTKVSGTQKRIQKVRRSIHELVMKVAHWKPLHPTFLELTQKTVYNINQYFLSFGCPVVEPDMTIQGLQEFIQHCSFQLIQFEAMISEEDAKSRIKKWKEKIQISHKKDRRHVSRG